MASETRVASRYAKSLLDLAVEKGLLEAVYEDMTLFNKTVHESPELGRMLRNPIIRNDKKKLVLQALFKGKLHMITGKFLEIISNKNRENHLPAIATEFLRQYREKKGISRAEIISTFVLTPELRRQFEKVVADISGTNKVELIEKVDPTLIGGYILRVGDKQIDESIRTKLESLEAEFKYNPFVKAI